MGVRNINLICLVAILLFAFGCKVKTISVKPLDQDYALLTEKIDGECSICISESDLLSEVVEGSALDQYRYQPYADFRFGLGYAMKNSCNSLRFFDSKQDAIANASQIILVPKVETKSNTSFPYWPPSDFSFALRTDVFSEEGELIQSIHSSGHATAGSSEWDRGWGYAGSKAMEQAIHGFVRQLDYDKINADLKSSPAAVSGFSKAHADAKPDVRKIIQTVKLYQGTLVFPPPMWIRGISDLGQTKFFREQKGNTFVLEQIPSDQEFDNWKNIYGIYGFHLPEYDMKRFYEESHNVLVRGCESTARIETVSAGDDDMIISYLCEDLQEPFEGDGDNAESGFLYLSRVDQSFAKVYVAWRAPREFLGTNRWPVDEALAAESIEQLKKIRYFKPE